MPPRNRNIQNVSRECNGSFYTVGGESLDETRSMASIYPISRDLTIRQTLSTQDYEAFSPENRQGRTYLEVMIQATRAYEKIGIVRNIIDLMGDFGSQGIKIVHPNPQVELFYKNWFEKVGGPDRSERFLNNLYRTGNVYIKKDIGKLNKKTMDLMKQGRALAAGNPDVDAYDMDLEMADKQPKNTIPIRYTFLDPVYMNIFGGDLGMFAGVQRYGFTLPDNLYRVIKSPRNPAEQEMVASLPDYVLDAVANNSKIITFDPSRISTFYYKKDDSQAWALPMTYSIMDDLIMLRKLKMADMVSLNGIISQVRVWTLGDLASKMFPTEAALEKLSDLLAQAGGNGQMLDIIWGPDIKLQESNTDMSKILDPKKYEATLSNIYAGLGVPATLTGSGGADAGFSNNFIGLKTLVERLNYGRDVLTRFWNQEIKLVQEAMGFRFPAKIEFKYAVLTDEVSQNRLILDLLDRDVIGLERVREHFGYIPEIEEANVRSDYKARAADKIPPKVSPYHDAQPDLTLKKIFAQTGVVTPGQVGIELDDKNPGEETSIDLQNKTLDVQKKLGMQKTKVSNPPSDSGPKSPSGQGRPPGSTDTTKRKQKKVTPRSKGFMLELWANAAQQEIGNVILPKYLAKCNKKNIQSLSVDEYADLEGFKFTLLCNVDPFEKVNESLVAEILQNPLVSYVEVNESHRDLINEFAEVHGRIPTIDEIRKIQSHIYAYYKGADYGQNSD